MVRTFLMEQRALVPAYQQWRGRLGPTKNKPFQPLSVISTTVPGICLPWRPRLSAATVASAHRSVFENATRLDNTIADVSAQRATFGAVSNRLTHAIDNLTNVKTNAEASRSRILDTDYSVATSEMARAQIIQQAGTAMLAQANALPQTVLALLK